MKILVAILTTGVRNITFEECLKSILAQRTGAGIELNVLVVENNKTAMPSVAASIAKFETNKSISIFHVLESTPGIPYARNKALGFAEEENFSHLAFIDDDAFANRDWIALLAQNIKGLDVSAGPQKALFPEDTSPLFNLAKVYHEREVTNGKIVNWAATNNLLINIETMKRLQLRFNVNLIHGGEDKELFLRLTMLGGQIKWVSNAVVQEHIVPNRLSVKWALKRCFRMGATGFQIESCNKTKAKVLATCIFKGSAYLAKGTISLVPFMISPKYTLLDSLCDFSHGIGFFYGIFTGGKVRRYA